MSAFRFKSKHGGFRWEDDSAFVYRKKKSFKSGWIYMTCVKNECPGTCKVKCDNEDSSRGECVVITDHLPESACKSVNSELRIEALRSTILQRAKTENTPNSIIFQQEINKAPVDIRNSLNFKEMERTMQRIHKSANPGSVKNFEEFEQLIMEWHIKYGEVNEEQFFLGRFGEGNEETLIAIVSPLTKVLQTSDEWHLDGTFKCRPKEPKFGQLFIVMASDQGRAFPIAWALMKSRTTRAYNVVFKALKDHISDLSPKLIMSDYEKAIHASVRHSFPNAKHTGCWFHFSQAIERKSRNLQIKHGEEGGCDVAKRLMATALLPHERIEEAVQVIEQLVESTPPTYRTKATRLLQYFKEEWMAKVTPLAFSVYGQKSRTNNCQETLNRNINRSIKPQGNTWDFWGGLLAISVKEINYHDQLTRGLECARGKKNKWLLQDTNIEKLQRKIEERRISIASFLTAASHRIATPSPSAADRRGDDDEDGEDVELSSLDVIAVEAAVDRREANPYLNYRWEPTQLIPENFMSLAWVTQQKLELERSVGAAHVEEREPAGEGCTACVLCYQYKPTRLCSPCGHANMCTACSAEFIGRESYYSVTNGNGDIEETGVRLPLICPVCRAIIGQIIRVVM